MYSFIFIFFYLFIPRKVLLHYHPIHRADLCHYHYNPIQTPSQLFLGSLSSCYMISFKRQNWIWQNPPRIILLRQLQRTLALFRSKTSLSPIQSFWSNNLDKLKSLKMFKKFYLQTNKPALPTVNTATISKPHESETFRVSFVSSKLYNQ